eukprot:1589919-Rhodomonas_salina.1
MAGRARSLSLKFCEALCESPCTAGSPARDFEPEVGCARAAAPCILASVSGRVCGRACATVYDKLARDSENSTQYGIRGR